MTDNHDFILKGDDPIKLFEAWLGDAEKKSAEVGDVFPNAMSVATADKNGKPSVRIILLKSVDQNGFVFYTNTKAQKGRDIAENPMVELCFYWPFLGRQVRVSGKALPVTEKEADAYFASRPRESQVGAWASEQSEIVGSRDELMQRYNAYEQKFQDQDVPRPDHWSGCLVQPERIEFWQLGDHRLHDRFVFEREHVDANWRLKRVCP